MIHVIKIIIIIGKDLAREKSPMIEIIIEVIDQNQGTGTIIHEDTIIEIKVKIDTERRRRTSKEIRRLGVIDLHQELVPMANYRLT
jgi:hypothetical protein